ncbi:putative ABC transporter permease protein [Austwickia sp. TVS 96-490-7B]|uniref:FecCD family ABC transporter permease n=1 Tax=Austwickia sp. TVS 96-490-7B TaxID=2830843 RepID=UPI001C58FD01|nr:iron ABC transporter permease [Austwickia sp. TVS 96-490-7B]MBW3087082.1 putative ABC transporter permease protein [Austwickia sp. TVS 96-490-7B]
MNIRAKNALTLIALLALVVLAPLISLGFGAAAVPIDEAFAIVAGRLTGIDTGPWDPAVEAIIWLNRVPRIVMALGVGAMLGVCGVAMQAVVRNPLAEPYVLGISSGAAAGAGIAIVIIGASSSWGIGSLAFTGAALASGLVLMIGTGRTGSTLRLILAGIAIGFVFQAITNLLIIASNNAETAQAVVFWGLGSLTRAGLEEALTVLGGAAALTALLWLVGPYLDALASGDEECLTVGINPTLTRMLLLIPISAGVALAVATSGGIGFIGLVIPHIMRPAVGHAHRTLVLGTALAAALFLLVTDTVARTALGAVEIPIGIITAILGAPVLLILVHRGHIS